MATPFKPVKKPLFSCCYLFILAPIAGAYLPA
jgi:hypothetical protein